MTTWHSPTTAAASVMCSVKVMRLQSSATGWSLLPALAARHAHLVRQAGEDARPLGHQRRAHLHRARALGERPRDVVAGLDAADRDQLEARARLQAELLEAGEVVPRDHDADAGLGQRGGEGAVGDADPLEYANLARAFGEAGARFAYSSAVVPAMLATTGQGAWAASSRTSGRSLS